MHDAELTTSARLVGAQIADLVNVRSLDAWPSQEWLARKLGLAIKTVQRATAQLVRVGWFTIEMDHRSWRYVPNDLRWANGARYPHNSQVKMSAIDGGQNVSDSGQNVRLIPVKMSSYPIYKILSKDGDPGATAEKPGNTAACGSERVADEGHAPLGACLTQLARQQGAPKFVIENSEPWLAWLDYRKRNGLPATLPVRQHLFRGRARMGWHMPTLWPPGYGPDSNVGAA
jgi:Helix-turn-helix domain